jgi:hypothetical protein
MVIKSIFVHSGWSYGEGDDQYDNESLGSTRKVFTLKKSMENSSRNKKNEYDAKMCSRQEEEEEKHTKDQGWTTIDTNSNRKPKSRTNNNTTIDSIISSIDVEFNIDKNGTLEASIDSPIQENRCIVSDKKAYNKKNKCTRTKQEQRIAQPTEEEERKVPWRGLWGLRWTACLPEDHTLSVMSGEWESLVACYYAQKHRERTRQQFNTRL